MIPILLATAFASTDKIHFRVDSRKPTLEVSKSLYGIFFEEINQAGEGGIYSELLHNRGFEGGGNDPLPIGWRATGVGTARLDKEIRLNEARSASLRLTGDVSLVNEGFWGVPLTRGGRYQLIVWSKGDQPLEARLIGEGGMHDSKTIPASKDWVRSEVSLRASGKDSKARIELVNLGTRWIGYTSLKSSQTWKRHGFRRDLADKLLDLRPAFVRFPGGCFVEGEWLSLRWKWKDTLGPIEHRKGMARTHWGYPASNGLGFHEYLQLCEDLGAEAMYVANVGMAHREVVPMSNMDEYVQEALDAIEYANGPATSKWGSVRAKNGHPKPFNLKYVQIGNENGGPAYNERFKLFSEAINAKYPNIVRIACLWGGRPDSAPYELIDEHYYNNPAWFWQNANRYDSYLRTAGPRVYVGEYAVTRGSGRGNLAGALAEAAFMTGMERNSDIVKLASYAPLFENVNNRQWNPNAVLFNATESYGTPSYWVQALFAQNRPDRILEHKFTPPKPLPEPIGGGIGLMTWRTDAEFKDITLTVDERKQEHPIIIEEPSGNWQIREGVIRQNVIQNDRRMKLGGFNTTGAKEVVVSLKAKKNSGDEGFIILFETSPRRTIQWNLGGWENTVHAFQLNDSRFGRGVPARIETGKWYDIRIEQTSDRIRGYLDGRLIEEVAIEPAPDFAAVAGLDAKANEVILKVVNGSGTSRVLALQMDGIKGRIRAKKIVLAGQSPLDENSFEAPMRVAPVRSETLISDATEHTFAPYSLTILRIPRK